MAARTLDDLLTPAAIIDLDRMEANLDRMASYTREAGIALRPHTKTHKTPELAAQQIKRGAVGVTVATLREAEVMASATDDILIAYPPVGAQKLDRLLNLPAHLRLTVGLDSLDSLRGLDAVGRQRDRPVGVLVEIDAGMHRVGVATPEHTLNLVRAATEAAGIEWRGLMFYPGHIREHVREQDASVAQLDTTLEEHLAALVQHGFMPAVFSGGSTPAAFQSHRLESLTEIRPGTYIFNDRTTAVVGACEWEDCAYTVLATVVSTAVPGQAVLDAGSKALSREDIRGADAPGFGQLLDRPDIVVKALSEEHGLLDLSRSDWRPKVGERVRIIPNHVCVSVNLHDRLVGVRGTEIEQEWAIQARNWSPKPTAV